MPESYIIVDREMCMVCKSMITLVRRGDYS